MKRPKLPNSGQGLLEAIIGIGIILAGTVGTITLMMSTIKANRSNIDKAVAANLARESIETARNLRDTNWLAIQSNTDANWKTGAFEPVGTFDDLFDVSDLTPQHIRIPVFTRLLNLNDYQCRNNPYPDGLNSFTWHFEDPSDFYNYVAADGNYTDQVDYRGELSECTYKYRGVTTFRCSQVFQNYDVHWVGDTFHGVGYGYFNQLPPYYDIDVLIPRDVNGNCKPVTPLERRACDNLSKLTPLVDENFIYYTTWYNDPDFCAGDIVSQRTVSSADNPLKVTTATRYQRWMKIDPICRLDEKDKFGTDVEGGDGIPDIPATERVEADENQKCAPNEIMVGLRLQSNVCWDDCPMNGSKTVKVEDRLYNWKYVK